VDVDLALPDVPILTDIVLVLAHGLAAEIGEKPSSRDEAQQGVDAAQILGEHELVANHELNHITVNRCTEDKVAAADLPLGNVRLDVAASEACGEGVEAKRDFAHGKPQDLRVSFRRVAGA